MLSRSSNTRTVMSCTTYRKSIDGPRALIWVPIDPTSFFGYLRPYPHGSSSTFRVTVLFVRNKVSQQCTHRLLQASCFPCVLSYLNSKPALVRLRQGSPTFFNHAYPIRNRRNRYCYQNRPFDLQSSQRQHGCLIRLPMLGCGTAFFRTVPENRRLCYNCCSPNWTWCPQYHSRNNDLPRIAEEVRWSHQVISEGSRRRKGCLLAQDRLESLKGWRSR